MKPETQNIITISSHFFYMYRCSCEGLSIMEQSPSSMTQCLVCRVQVLDPFLFTDR